MRIFVCKLHLHFPNTKHLRGLVCHDIFGNFFHHSEIFGLHTPPPTIHASYGPGYRLADWNFSRSPANYILSSYTSLKKALNQMLYLIAICIITVDFNLLFTKMLRTSFRTFQIRCQGQTFIMKFTNRFVN